MAKEAILVQEGKTIDYTLTADTAVGEVIPFIGMCGVAATAGLTGEIIAVELECVYEVKAADADTFAVGDLAYFDATDREMTTVSTDNVRAGRAVSAKAGATAGVVRVKFGAA